MDEKQENVLKFPSNKAQKPISNTTAVTHSILETIADDVRDSGSIGFLGIILKQNGEHSVYQVGLNQMEAIGTLESLKFTFLSLGVEPDDNDE